MSASTQPATTHLPLLRYLRATPITSDYAGNMLPATSTELTHNVIMPVPGPGSDEEGAAASGEITTEASADAAAVLDLLFTPRDQRLYTPPAVPVDHPAVVVIVDHGGKDDGAGKLVLERSVLDRGAATVRALQDFVSGWLYLPARHLPPEMIREPYYDGEEIDTVSYSEIVTALAGGTDPRSQAEARWDIQDRLQLAVYRVAAHELITPEAVAYLPYC